MIRVLYLFDHEGWALHNVGLFWAKLLENTHRFDFYKLGIHRDLQSRDFDYILFGCTLMAERHLRVKQLLFRLGLYANPWLPAMNTNFVSVIHDPCELFPMIPQWKDATPITHRLAHFKRLAVISNEMQNILAGLGFQCLKVNTSSLLPLRYLDEINQSPLAILSRANPVARKNTDLFHRLKMKSDGLAARFDGYFDRRILPIQEYQQLLDGYNCYVCTSWQEGGPLPLLDAMHRGCAILTTPVGQTDEWVEHGGNGFFCTNEHEFMDRIHWFATHPESLLACRHRSLEIAGRDICETIRTQLSTFLH